MKKPTRIEIVQTRIAPISMGRIAPRPPAIEIPRAVATPPARRGVTISGILRLVFPSEPLPIT